MSWKVLFVRLFFLMALVAIFFQEVALAAAPLALPEQLWVVPYKSYGPVFMASDCSNFSDMEFLGWQTEKMGVVAWKTIGHETFVVVSPPMPGPGRENKVQVAIVGSGWVWVVEPPAQQLWVMSQVDGASIYTTPDSSNFSGPILNQVMKDTPMRIVSWKKIDGETFVVVSPPTPDRENMIRFVILGPEWAEASIGFDW